MIPEGLEALYVLGDYWHADEPVRTELGDLVHAAKDGHEHGSANRLAKMVTALVPGRLDELDAPVVVAAVPPNPVPPLHLPSVLAGALAAAGVGEWGRDLIRRAHPTSRLRDSDPAGRPELVRAAGYSSDPMGEGTTVVLVDDVVLTGTTLSHVAECLRNSGAARVIGVAAVRTRCR